MHFCSFIEDFYVHISAHRTAVLMEAYLSRIISPTQRNGWPKSCQTRSVSFHIF